MDLMKFLPPWMYPIVHLFLSFVCFHLALNAPSYQSRLFHLPFIILFSALSFTYFTNLPPTAGLPSIWAQSLAVDVVHIVSLFLIESWPTPASSQSAGAWRSSLHTSYRLWINPRLIPVSESLRLEAEERTVARFLLSRLGKLLLYYCMRQHIQPWLFVKIIGRLRAADVEQITPLLILYRVTPREAAVRSYAAVSWVWDNFVLMDGLHAALSILAVLLGVDRSDEWPPLFGGPENVCGLRNFWSRFWHRLARRSYVNHGRVVARGLRFLGLFCSGGTAENFIIALTVFLISGFSHAVVSWQMGWTDWLDVKWFLLNFMACLAETVVIGTIRRAAVMVRRQHELAALEASRLGQIIGFTWVFGFFFWSVPLWQFPRLHQELAKAEHWESIMSHWATSRR